MGTRLVIAQHAADRNADPERGQLVLAYRNDDVRRLNADIRVCRGRRLARPGRSRRADYAAGDHLVFLKDHHQGLQVTNLARAAHRGQGVKNGTLARSPPMTTPTPWRSASPRPERRWSARPRASTPIPPRRPPVSPPIHAPRRASKQVRRRPTASCTAARPRSSSGPTPPARGPTRPCPDSASRSPTTEEQSRTRSRPVASPTPSVRPC